MSGTSSMPLGAIEDALRAWVLTGSRLPDGSVAWDGPGPRPTTPFISLKLEVAPVGVDEVKYSRDATSNGHDGHELVATARGDRRGTLTLQAFALPAADGSETSVAVGLLADVAAARMLPSVRRALRAAKVGVAKVSPAQSIGGRVVNMTTFEPRAVMTVTLNLSSAIAESATVIDTIHAGVTADTDTPPTFTATAS